MNFKNAVFNNGNELSVWIDTGVVIFTGYALESIISLFEFETINKCTDRYAKLHPNDDLDLRLELYSDILLALKQNNRSNSLNEYLLRLGISIQQSNLDLNHPYNNALTLLHKQLNNIPLYLLAVKNGLFSHMGTSNEMLDLVIYPIIRNDSCAFDSSKLNKLLTKYMLKKNLNSVILNDISILKSNNNNQYFDISSFVVLNSILSNDSVNKISELTFIEHSFLSGSFQIGSKCILSHIGYVIGRDLKLPSCTIIQEVPLIDESGHFTRSFKYFAVSLLGLNDDVKVNYSQSTATIYGSTWGTFFDVFFLF